MSKHTPGPWTQGAQTFRYCIYDAKQLLVAHTSTINGENNARLIAAAPELLVAAQAVVNLLTRETQFGGEELTILLNIAEAAIAKAEKGDT